MRLITRSLLAVPAVALVAACSGTPDRESSLSADLQKDLDLAKATGVELASAADRGPSAVSALEAAPVGRTAAGERVARPTPKRSPTRAPTPRRAPRAQPDEAPVASEVAEVEAATAESPTPEPAPTLAEAPAETGAGDEPVVLSGPQVTPEGIGSGRPRDPGGFGGEGAGDGGIGGGGGGVVVRGGGVGDDDKCEIHWPGRRGGGVISIGRRFPVGGVYGGSPVIIPSTGGRERVGGSIIRSRGGSSGSTPAPVVSSGGGGRRRM